jgi:adenosine deaminase
MPKVDLHRHLEGALRVETLAAIGGEVGERATRSLDELRRRVTHTAADPHDPGFFLTRFKAIREYFLDRDVIEHLTRSVIIDAANDNIRYLELRLTPVAIAARAKLSLDEVTVWVIEAANDEAQLQGLSINFLLSFNRNEPVDQAREVLEIALATRKMGVVGLDLAGDERSYPAAPFAPIMSRARDEGLGISVHAGEWGDSAQIAYAIEEMGASRIGHGVQVLENAKLVEQARKAGVCFEVSLTSNERTGAVSGIGDHPLPEMLQAGLQVALTTDDPGIFETTLSEEHALAVESLGLSIETIKGMTLGAIQASFMDKKTMLAKENEFVQAIWGGRAAL